MEIQVRDKCEDCGGSGLAPTSDTEPCSECEGSTWTYRWVPVVELPELKRLRMGIESLDSMLWQEVARIGGR